MPTKRFQAETMMEALELVQQEMGPEAIVLSSREVLIGSPWQVWRKPGIEVIAMTADKQTATPAGEKRSAVIKSSASQPKQVEWGEDRSQIEWVQEEPQNAAPLSRPNHSAQSSATQRENLAPTLNPAGDYISRRQAAIKTSALPKVESEVLLPDKPAVNTIPARKGGMQATPNTEANSDLPEGLAQARLRLAAQGVDSGLVDRLVRTTQTAFSPAMLVDGARSQTLIKRQLEAGLKWKTIFCRLPRTG